MDPLTPTEGMVMVTMPSLKMQNTPVHRALINQMLKCWLYSAIYDEQENKTMTALAKFTAGQNRRRPMIMGREAVGTFVRRDQMAEALEDARLNAIADERAAGPFVRVSLDDL
jgi:hypothetical protein